MNVKYKVTLNMCEHCELEKLTSSGKNSARQIKRAQILLMSNNGTYEDKEISEILSISASTIYRVIRNRLKENDLKPWQKKITNISAQACPIFLCFLIVIVGGEKQK